MHTALQPDICTSFRTGCVCCMRWWQLANYVLWLVWVTQQELLGVNGIHVPHCRWLYLCIDPFYLPGPSFSLSFQVSSWWMGVGLGWQRGSSTKGMQFRNADSDPSREGHIISLHFIPCERAGTLWRSLLSEGIEWVWNFGGRDAYYFYYAFTTSGSHQWVWSAGWLGIFFFSSYACSTSSNPQKTGSDLLSPLSPLSNLNGIQHIIFYPCRCDGFFTGFSLLLHEWLWCSKFRGWLAYGSDDDDGAAWASA